MSERSADHNTETFSGLRINAHLEEVEHAPRQSRLVITLSCAVQDYGGYQLETKLRELDTCSIIVPNGLLSIE